MLSSQQQQAYFLALDWWRVMQHTAIWKTSFPAQFILQGYAGVGKSYSAAEIIKAFADEVDAKDCIDVALCAPTHKAVRVLESFADQHQLKAHPAIDELRIDTLHSLLQIAPGQSDHTGKRRIKRIASSQPHYSEYDLVVVDEASMVSKELLSFIPPQTMTIFMGDPAQLPPVEEDSKNATSPVFDLDCPAIELTEVMRYSGNIADFVTRIRTELSATHSPWEFATPDELEIVSFKSFRERAIASSAQTDWVINPHQMRVLAFKNKTVGALNQEIKQALFPQETRTFFNGLRIFAKEPIIQEFDGKPRILLQTCAEATVTTVRLRQAKVNGIVARGLMSNDIPALDIQVYDLELLSDSGIRLFVLTIADESWQAAQDYFKSLRSIINCLPSKARSERAALWNHWYKAMEAFSVMWKGELMHRLQPAYGLTVHQSQGSTFESVFVDFQEISRVREPQFRNRLLYVACSRASKRLILSA